MSAASLLETRRKASAGNHMIRIDGEKIKNTLQERGGLATWLISRLQIGAYGRVQSKPRLALLERISLAPRQSLALVEAEGRRFLVGTSPDGCPVFYALDGLPEAFDKQASLARPAKTHPFRPHGESSASGSARVSW